MFDLWVNPQTNGFHEFINCSLFCCRWIVYSWRRSTATDGWCKDNTSKDPFSQCENLQNLQGIHIQVKSEYVGTLTTSEVMTRMQSDKHNNMYNVAASLKHVNTGLLARLAHAETSPPFIQKSYGGRPIPQMSKCRCKLQIVVWLDRTFRHFFGSLQVPQQRTTRNTGDRNNSPPHIVIVIVGANVGALLVLSSPSR